MRYAFFVMVTATSKWLQLARPERARLAEAHLIAPVRDRPGLSLRYFDAEAFSARCSDVMMLETDDPASYYYFIEALRDSPLISESYFELVEILPTIEEGFKAYEADLAAAL
jgi:hypothetical protein